MPLALHILAATLNAASILLLVYWSVALYRFLSTSRRIPTARAGIALATAKPPQDRVCTIIPAHNEEASIAPLIHSLKAQDHPRLTIILCLDRCTDSTAAVARDAIASDPRFTLLEITSCPEGWAGKVHAVWQGARHPAARDADLLLFADADTAFHPSCISATSALLRHRNLDLLSLLSTLTSSSWFERLVQPAAGMELVRQYPIDRANRPPGTRRRAFANGQFMLFKRDAYEAVGGHEAVKDELLEDLALARAMADADNGTRRLGLFLADGLLSCRMYDSWPAFRRGWKRIYTEAAKCKAGRLVAASRTALTTGALLPALALLNLAFSLTLLVLAGSPAGRAGPAPDAWSLAQAWSGGDPWSAAARTGLLISVSALLPWSAVVLGAYRAGHAPLRTAPGSIIGSFLVSRILSEAARDLKNGIPTTWAGRTYTRRPR